MHSAVSRAAWPGRPRLRLWILDSTPEISFWVTWCGSEERRTVSLLTCSIYSGTGLQ